MPPRAAPEPAATADTLQHRADELRARSTDRRLEARKRQVKVSWSRRKVGASYSEDSIAGVLRRFGAVQEVEMGEKGKSAKVTFERAEAAAAPRPQNSLNEGRARF